MNFSSGVDTEQLDFITFVIVDTQVQNQDFLFKKMCEKLLENILFPTSIFFSKMSKKLFIFLSFFRPKIIIKVNFTYWGMHFLHIFYYKIVKENILFFNIIQPENKMFWGAFLIHFLDQKILIPNL